MNILISGFWCSVLKPIEHLLVVFMSVLNLKCRIQLKLTLSKYHVIFFYIRVRAKHGFWRKKITRLKHHHSKQDIGLEFTTPALLFEIIVFFSIISTAKQVQQKFCLGICYLKNHN